MPLRRKVGRRSGRGQGSSSSTRQPLGSSHTPPRTNVTRPLHVPSNPTGILPPVTPTTGSFNPPSILTTPPLSHSQRSTPRILNQSISDISLATPPSSSVTSTPASFFSSPSAFVQPQALDSMFNEHPNAPYIRLNHIATVTTTRQYISTEIVKPSGTVVHTEFNEVIGICRVLCNLLRDIYLSTGILQCSSRLQTDFIPSRTCICSTIKQQQ